MKLYYLINLCIIEDYYANLNTKYKYYFMILNLQKNKLFNKILLIDIVINIILFNFEQKNKNKILIYRFQTIF